MSESLADRGARVVSVFGPFNRSALVEMPAKLAEELLPGDGMTVGRAETIDAARREVDAIRAVDEDLADSMLAATLVEMGYLLANPFNSATSKAQCAAQVRECLSELRALLPPKQTSDAIDDIAAARARRQAAAREAGAAT